MVSATIRNIPPTNVDAGRTQSVIRPTTRRTACGMIMPMNPIMPAEGHHNPGHER